MEKKRKCPTGNSIEKCHGELWSEEDQAEGYDDENRPFDPVGRRGELLNDLVMEYGDECGYHNEDNGDHIIP